MVRFGCQLAAKKFQKIVRSLYHLEQYFAPFLEFFFPDAYAAIDWSQPVTFRDTDLQQIAPEIPQGKQRVDKLVEVTRRDGTPAWVLIPIEIQSQHDDVFAERMLLYHARILDRERRPAVSLAVLGDEDPAWRPNAYRSALWGCSLSLRLPTVKLLDLDPAALEGKSVCHADAERTRWPRSSDGGT